MAKSTFWSDFKNFIAKGNVIDMAVGVVVGGAFNKIVTSLVNDIIMPLISLLVGGKSVADWKYVITAADEEAGISESAVYYGNFIQNIIDFILVALTIFIVLRVFTKLQNKRKKEEEKKD